VPLLARRRAEVPPGTADDSRMMAAALGLARRGAGRTGSNPNVGCLIVKDGRLLGRGWTQDGGRPHAEAVALAGAGDAARGATAFVTLEPCAHESDRGAPCADSLIAAGIARAAVAMPDPDPRTAGLGIARLKAAGIQVSENVLRADAERELAGFSGRLAHGRPELVLKLALSLDGRLAQVDGTSQWITGGPARAYGHALRASADMILVGGGTFRADAPLLTSRLPGNSAPQPLRAVLTEAAVPEGFHRIANLPSLDSFATARGVNRILCEGGGRLAAALLAADRVDRLVLLRAPILIGDGIGLEGFAPASLAEAHGQWALEERRPLGLDLLECYARAR